MAGGKRTKGSKVVRLTAIGFSLVVGAGAAQATTGAEATDPVSRLERLAQARAEGALDIRYDGRRAAGQGQKSKRTIEMLNVADFNSDKRD
jgi:hypothetical protein